MKYEKWFMVLCCAFLIPSVQAEKAISYEIDPVATVNAPWGAGETVVDSFQSCYGETLERRFLGVTKEGYYIIQDFYKIENTKQADPLALKRTECIKNPSPGLSCVADGPFAEYYPDGKITAMGNIKNEIEDGLFRSWYPNGQKAMEGQYENGKLLGTWRRWDGQGNLLAEKNYRVPQ